MLRSTDPFFEPRPHPDEPTWEIVVTWEHALRDQIPNLFFGSREEAITWIETRSIRWLRKEKRCRLEDSAVHAEKISKGELPECGSKAALWEHKAFLAADDSLQHSYQELVRSWRGLANRAASGLASSQLLAATGHHHLEDLLQERKAPFCVSAWNKDPAFGMIGIQSGPRH